MISSFYQKVPELNRIFHEKFISVFIFFEFRSFNSASGFSMFFKGHMFFNTPVKWYQK